MISGAYPQEMAQYNRWKYKQLSGFLQAFSPDDQTRERGTFFGSIMGAANHLLRGNWIWVSGFEKGECPGGVIPRTVSLCADLVQWVPLCETVSARIPDWAGPLGDAPLTGDFTCLSAAKEADVTCFTRNV